MADKLQCEYCGCEFDRPHSKGIPPRYCKPAHRQRAYERRIKNELFELRKRVARHGG